MNTIRFATVIALLAAAVGASASFAASTPTVTVAMHDPSCHWFLVGGKYERSLTVHGTVSLLNVDEAALKVRTVGLDALHGTRLDPVGSRLTLERGVYHITMVGQAPDDNHLVLTVR